MALEDTIDAAEFQDKQLEKKVQSAMYQERRRAEFVELSGKHGIISKLLWCIEISSKCLYFIAQLQMEYQRKKSEYEEKQKSISQEKQIEFQKKFDQDLRRFQNSGKAQVNR
jgi:hypothetical protein